MPSSKEYLKFVLEQLSEIEGISHRAMMGEYLLYCREKLFGGIYDDRFLVKPTASALRMMPDASQEVPYDGAKPMLMVEDMEDRDLLQTLVREMCAELPEPKKKK